MAQDLTACRVESCKYSAKSVAGEANHYRMAHAGHDNNAHPVPKPPDPITLPWETSEGLPPLQSGGFGMFFRRNPVGVAAAIPFALAGWPYWSSGQVVFGAVTAAVAVLAAIGATFFLARQHYRRVAIFWPPDAKSGRLVFEIGFWPKSLAELLPRESRHRYGRGWIYSIDAFSFEYPIAFDAFTVERPEYAVPVRGAMVNSQHAFKDLTKPYGKLARGEILKTGFAMAVIGALIAANLFVVIRLVDVVNGVDDTTSQVQTTARID